MHVLRRPSAAVARCAAPGRAARTGLFRPAKWSFTLARGRGARAAKRPATRSEQAQRKKKPRVAEAAEQAQQDGEAPAPQPAAPEAQQGGVAAPAGQPAAAEVPLLDLLLDAVDQDQAAAAPAGLTAELVGAYWAQHLDLLEAQQAGKVS